MDINYFMKIQNAYDTKSRREKELVKINHEMSNHFKDTFDTEEVLLNGIPIQLMIIKDTDGNIFKKKIKSVHGDKFNLGDYVYWNDQVWLITLVDVDKKTWNRGYMYLCTVPLRWQNLDGKIIERWAYAEDFTKYSNGITGNSTITVGDNQYGLTLPIDSETKKLKRDMRFSMDFDDSEQPDIYKLTNRKVKLNDNQYFGRGGTMIVTMSFDAFNPNDDKRVSMEDGQEVWICNYNNSHTPLPPTLPPNETADLRCEVKGDTNLKIGYFRSYTAYLFNREDVALEWNNSIYCWKVISKFPVEQVISENIIKLKVRDESLIGSSFLLQLIKDDEELVLYEAQITIVELIR